jgi:hypothetical protein
VLKLKQQRLRCVFEEESETMLKRRDSVRVKAYVTASRQVDGQAKAEEILARWRYLAAGQWIALGLICSLIAVLHVVLFQRSGAFWRDECSSILLAHAPSWPEMWRGLNTDSFPGLFVSVLRVWIQAGPGASDVGIRLLGILISIGTIVSVVGSCRAMQVKAPVLALVLLGLNPTIFYAGTSIRAYGLAALLIVACFGLFWRVATQPTRWNLVSAFLFSVLSIHSNYQNCYLLFGIGTAAAVVAAGNRKFLRSGLILATCFVAALTMLVYQPIIAAYRRELIISNFQLSLAQIGGTLKQALSEGNLLVLAAWIALTVSLLVFLVLRGVQISRAAGESTAPSPILYCLLTLLVSAITGIAFFKYNGMFPFVWHYVPFVALCAVGVECGIQNERYSPWISSGKIVVAVILAAACFPAVWSTAHLRRTNMDKIAAHLESLARPDDVILVNPFWLRPSFKKYYRGPVFWRIVPVDPSDRNVAWHANEASIRTIMAKSDSIRPTLEVVQATLSKGGRVWIVGGVELLPPNTKPPELIPAPHPQFGWDNNAYTQIWSLHLGYFLQQHAANLHVPLQPEKEGVCPMYMENRPLFLIEGWRP